jgi:hypothetical protein
VKCKKCKRGKIRDTNTLWTMLGACFVYGCVIGECTQCGYQMRYFKRTRYPARPQVKGTLNPHESLDDDWLDNCEERQLEHDNPEEAWVLEQLKKDYNEQVLLLGRSVGKSTAVLSRKTLKDSMDAMRYGLTSKKTAFDLVGLDYAAMEIQMLAAMAVPKHMMEARKCI